MGRSVGHIFRIMGRMRGNNGLNDEEEISDSQSCNKKGEGKPDFEIFKKREFDAERSGLFGNDEVGDGAQEGEVAGESGDDGEEIPEMGDGIGGAGGDREAGL